ncbi:transcription regulatory protein [Cyclospora cayetanensis]|uniref:Transcription regulatory protein n=1 Tax=Cyclospora cayetanensis TaxID=88456 RepID=A0A1D3CTV2_9EIME|nr:transcription regulatory protein [Cyclospora cayetanensis]
MTLRDARVRVLLVMLRSDSSGVVSGETRKDSKREDAGDAPIGAGDAPMGAGSCSGDGVGGAVAENGMLASDAESASGEASSSSEEEFWGVGGLERPKDEGDSCSMQERARLSRLQRRLLLLAPFQKQVREQVAVQRLTEVPTQLPPLQHLPVLKRKKMAAVDGGEGSAGCGHPLHPTDCGCPGGAAFAAQMRKERLDALRKHDEAGYLKLLQETKNERLLQLVRQTEGYMQQIGSLVVEQREREGISTEEEAEGAAEEASGSLSSSFLFSKERYYRITHSQREKVTELPSCLKGGTLRSYQMEGLNWLVSLHNNGLNGILADCMGLGKTVQTVSFLAYLYEKKGVRNPHLILAPLSTLHGNWRLEFKKWWPSLRIVVYEGAKDVRKALRSRIVSGVRVEGSGQETQRFLEPLFDVLLTTDAFVLRDKSFLKKIQWEYLIVDEAHRLKNPNSKLVQTLNSGFFIRRRTPLQNDIVEVWALLNFLMPSIFNAKLNFEQWMNVPLGGAPLGGPGATGEDQPHAITVTEEEKLLIVDRLHKVLRPFLLRREKAEVADELPSKQEEIVWCPLSGIQRILYRIIEESPMGHNRMVQLRKVCNHPFLFCFSSFTPDESLVRCCGKFAMLDVLLPALKAAQHRVLVFSQMTKLLDLLEAYLSLRGYRYLRLDGGTSSEERQTRLALYNQENSPYFLFILSTKAGGLGVNLQSADTVIIFDSDWNPQNDEQAQSRAHRIGQKREVLTIRFVTPSSVEEQILHSAELKLDKDALVIKSGMYNGELQDRESERQEQVREILRRRKQLEANLTRPFDFAILKNQLSRNPEESRVFEVLQRIRQLLHLPGLIYGEAVPPCLFRWSKTVERSQVVQHGQRESSIPSEPTVFSLLPACLSLVPLRFLRLALSALWPEHMVCCAWALSACRLQIELVQNTAQAAQDWKLGYSLSDFWSTQRKKKMPSGSVLHLQLVGSSNNAPLSLFPAASTTTPTAGSDYSQQARLGDLSLQQQQAAQAQELLQPQSLQDHQEDKQRDGQPEQQQQRVQQPFECAVAPLAGAGVSSFAELSTPHAATEASGAGAADVGVEKGPASVLDRGTRSEEESRTANSGLVSPSGGVALAAGSGSARTGAASASPACGGALVEAIASTLEAGVQGDAAPPEARGDERNSASRAAANAEEAVSGADTAAAAPIAEAADAGFSDLTITPTPATSDIASSVAAATGGERAAAAVVIDSAADAADRLSLRGSAATGGAGGSRAGVPGGSEDFEDPWGCGEGLEGDTAGASAVCLADPQRWKTLLNGAISQALTEAIQDPRFSAFVELPSLAVYKDYYERVPKPVCLLQIRKFSDKQEFTSLNKLEKYLTRLAENARAYNGQESPLFLRALECIGSVLMRSRVNACIAFHSLHNPTQGERMHRLFQVYRSCWDSTASTPLPAHVGLPPRGDADLIAEGCFVLLQELLYFANAVPPAVYTHAATEKGVVLLLLLLLLLFSLWRVGTSADAESTGPGGASLSGELMEGEAEADDDEVSAVSSQLSSTVRSVGSYSRSVTSSVLQPSRGSAANSYYDSYSKKQRRAAVREAEAASAVAAYPFASVAPSGPPSLGSSAIQTAPGVYQDADPAACGFSQSQQPPTPFGGASSSLSGVAMWPPLMQQQFPATPQGVVSLGAEGLSHEKKGKRDRKGKAGKAKKKERDSSPSFHPAQQQMDYMPAPAAPQIVEGTPQRPQGMKPLRIRLSFGAQQQQQPVSAAVPHQLPMQQTQPVYTYPEPHDPQQPTQQQPMQQQPVQQHSFYAQPPYPPAATDDPHPGLLTAAFRSIDISYLGECNGENDDVNMRHQID